jgi:hypothetical protein
MGALCSIFEALYILFLHADIFLDYRWGSSVMSQPQSAAKMRLLSIPTLYIFITAEWL